LETQGFDKDAEEDSLLIGLLVAEHRYYRFSRSVAALQPTVNAQAHVVI
jgi:hypothetical protein